MKKILIVGHGSSGKTDLTVQMLKEKHGEDIQVYTADEALKKGLDASDFDNIPSFPISSTIVSDETYFQIHKTGKERRRERRKRERDLKKGKG
jgi:GTPase SAR1 family protein